VRFLGDSLALLNPREGENMGDIIKLNREWFDNFFTSIKPWSVSSVADHKIVWVRCYGLPLSFWNKECFAKVLGESTTLVSVDTSTLLWENLEYARLQVRSRLSCNTRTVKSTQINNHTCSILTEEEAPVNYGGLHMDNHCDLDSSDSVSSTETYVKETILSTKSCEEGENRGSGRFSD